jgi:uncharacterized protein YaaN involved in tellurite resistance
MEEVSTAALQAQQVQTDQIPVDLSKLTADERKRLEEIQGQINFEDSNFITQYGVGAQSKISGFADTMLDQIRSKDSGYVGEVITDLMLKVKDIDVGSLGNNKGVLSGIPFIGGMMDAVKKFIAKYEKLSVSLENIINELEKARMQLLKDITLLDTMYEKNLEYLKDLDLYIAAGLLKVKEYREKELPALKAKAEASKDALDAQKYNDQMQMVDRFEKKVHDLKLSRMIAIQAAPQLRLIQNNNQVLVEKIQSSIMNTIPLWKNQMVIAISIFRQKKALEVQKDVTDTTNDLLLKNSEMLKMNTIAVAKENERGIVDIETLKKTHNDLISTMEETLKIQEDGKVKRAAAEQELASLEQELKNKLTSMK